MYSIFSNTDPVDISTLMTAARSAADAYEDSNAVEDPERMAGMALELARLHDQILDVLEPLKEALRSVARGDLVSEDGVVELEGVSESDDLLGRVTVTFPASTVKLNKGADIDRLRRALGPRFSDYFEEATAYTPRKDFKARTAAALLSPEAAAEVRVAMASVKVIDPTPRVGFKPDVA